MPHSGRRLAIEPIPYDAERHRGGVRGVLAKNHWEGRYTAGQLYGLHSLSAAPASGTLGRVYVHEAGGRVGGFVSVEFREWNRLGQLHGLAVEPGLKRRGIASVLVGRAEGFVRGEGGRGVYADTPVINDAARGFYEALGYRQAYVMLEYYDEGLDGVTYLKLFPKQGGNVVCAALFTQPRRREKPRTSGVVCSRKAPGGTRRNGQPDQSGTEK